MKLHISLDRLSATARRRASERLCNSALGPRWLAYNTAEAGTVASVWRSHAPVILKRDFRRSLRRIEPGPRSLSWRSPVILPKNPVFTGLSVETGSPTTARRTILPFVSIRQASTPAEKPLPTSLLFNRRRPQLSVRRERSVRRRTPESRRRRTRRKARHRRCRPIRRRPPA
jgi:hypothetical protein